MTATAPEQTGPDPRLLLLAAKALHYAMAEDWERASRAVQVLGDAFGGDGCVTAMLGWADTLISRTPGLAGDGRPVRLAFQTLETGHIDYNADDVPDDVRWAGRLLAARAADDRDTFEALINSVPDDATWSKYVGAVLKMSALNLRAAQAAATSEEGGQ